MLSVAHWNVKNRMAGVNHLVARRIDLIGLNEAHSLRDTLRRTPGYRLFNATDDATTLDKKRGRWDTAILVRDTLTVADHGGLQLSDIVPKNKRVAPERWATWVIVRLADGSLHGHVCVHLNAAPVALRAPAAVGLRGQVAEQYGASVVALASLLATLSAKVDSLTVAGDVNLPASVVRPWSPHAALTAAGLAYTTAHLDVLAWRGLTPVATTETLPRALGNTDHEGLASTFAAPVVTPPKPTAPTAPPKPQQPEEPNMLPSNLPQILRDAGLKVNEVPGWQGRGRPGLFRPGGVLLHHTATSTRSSDSAVINLLVRGRSDLPGPLCQLGLSRDGTVHIVAAGRANHAGKAKSSGTMVGGDGNQLYIGIEAFNDGVGERWPAVQYEAYVLLAATLSLHITGNSERTVRGHKETSVTGKIDPRFDMNAFRADAAAAMKKATEPTPPRVPAPKPARTSRLSALRSALLTELEAGSEIPKNRPAAQAWLKRVREAVNSGPKS